MMNGIENITINNIIFQIGYTVDAEFSGYVCAMRKNGEWQGVLFVNSQEREIGWNTGIMATDAEIEAIEKARAIMREKYGENRWHG